MEPKKWMNTTYSIQSNLFRGALEHTKGVWYTINNWTVDNLTQKEISTYKEKIKKSEFPPLLEGYLYFKGVGEVKTKLFFLEFYEFFNINR